MMPQQKHLRELLKEDQEPFLLKSFIADKRSQLQRPSPPKTQIQATKRKPIFNQKHIVSNFTHNLCKDACLFSFNDSIDSKTSPLFQLKSPLAKSPNATLLLEASLKIQKQSSKSKTLNRNNGFGLFGSFLKRLTQRNRTRKQEISGVDGVKASVSVREILRWDSSVGRRNHELIQKINSPEISNGRLSSAVWSDSNEGKSLDFDFASSSQSEGLLDEEEIEFIRNVFDDSDFTTSCEKRFCEESPFRFVLTRSPSSGVRTPAFSSPATSPTRHEEEEKENPDVESLKKYQEEEDKEQCSPVSVLDPPFEDDDEDVHNDGCEDGEELDSYAIVQRAKSQLLRKLRRFEKLAELDPIELEKRMLAREDEDDEVEVEVEDQYCNNVKSFDSLVAHHLNKSGHIPMDMKSLVLDLIDEESREKNNYHIDREVIAKRVCKRLESWKEVECNTIDMMIEQDFRRGAEDWKKIEEELKECSCDIEVAIVGLLLEELTEDLMSV